MEMREKNEYVAPMAQLLRIVTEDVLYDSNEGGWAPVNDEEEE